MHARIVVSSSVFTRRERFSGTNKKTTLSSLKGWKRASGVKPVNKRLQTGQYG
jgi:hypothetical protein